MGMQRLCKPGSAWDVGGHAETLWQTPASRAGARRYNMQKIIRQIARYRQTQRLDTDELESLLREWVNRLPDY